MASWKARLFSAAVCLALVAHVAADCDANPSLSSPVPSPSPNQPATTTTGAFIKGVNVPWQNYGWDFGIHPQWGHSFNPSQWEASFRDAAAAGTTLARIWVFSDGRAAPEFDPVDVGRPLGLEPQFFDDMDSMLNIAQKYNIKVMLVLIDFYILGQKGQPGNPNRASLFLSPTNTDLFMEKVMVPMVQRYADHPALYGYDILNEPEWMFDEAGDAGQMTLATVPAATLQRFVAKCAVIIHKLAPEQTVTVGVAGLKWLCTFKEKGCVGHFFSDEILQAAVDSDKELAYQDYYQVHYYDWMYQYHNPFAHPVGYFAPTDKPIIIGEVYGSNKGKYTPAQLMQLACQNGYAGLLFWSMNGGDGVGGWDAFRDDLTAYRGCATLPNPLTSFFTHGAAVTSQVATDDVVVASSAVGDVFEGFTMPRKAGVFVNSRGESVDPDVFVDGHAGFTESPSPSPHRGGTMRPFKVDRRPRKWAMTPEFE